MLGVEVLYTRRPTAALQMIERSVALAHRDCIFFWNVRQHFAEPPDPALVKAIG